MSKSQEEIAVETLKFNKSMEKVFISPDKKSFVSKNAAINYSVQNKLKSEDVKEFDRSILEKEGSTAPSYEALKEMAAELGFEKKGMVSKVELIEFIESKNQA